jgi:hypothetical protein
LPKLPLHQIRYKHTIIETASIQENFHPSLRKGNGGIVCRKCLGPGEYAFSRERGRRYTAETGPVVEMMLLTVYRCPVDGLYSTIFPDDIVRNKQYCLSEIRCALENRKDFSMASPRTRANWRAWFKGMWEAVVTRIQLSIGCNFPKKDISTALLSFCRKVGDGWLRYVLDLFHTESNNLCMFLDLVATTITPGSEKLHKSHVHGDAESFPKRGKPPPGG